MALFLSLSLSACQSVDAQRPGAGFVSFQKTVVDTGFRGGYGLTVVDIDGDGLNDIVALAMTPAQLVWYKNPTWERHVITTATTANVDVASQDINGDGYTDLVLSSAFNLRDSAGGGLVHWLENPGNPPINQEWQMHLIDELPTSHRLRWADLNGDGKKQLINLPIIGAGAQAPAARPPVMLVRHGPGRQRLRHEPHLDIGPDAARPICVEDPVDDRPVVARFAVGILGIGVGRSPFQRRFAIAGDQQAMHPHVDGHFAQL